MAIMEAIATTRLEKKAISVTFTDISGYEHLQLKASCITDNAGIQEQIYLRFNDDTAGNYYYTRLMAYQSTTYANVANQTGAGFVSVNSQEAHLRKLSYSNLDITIFDYLNTNKNTSVQVRNNYATSATAWGNTMSGGGVWNNTAAVTSITLGQASSVGTYMLRGSAISLYGIKSS